MPGHQFPDELLTEIWQALRKGGNARRAWQPQPGYDANVVILSSNGLMWGDRGRLSCRGGQLAALEHLHESGEVHASASVASRYFWEHSAWALIGTTSGGPLPEPERFVLVRTLDPAYSTARVVRVPTAEDRGHGVEVDLGYGARAMVDWWALLPLLPVVEAPPVEVEGGDLLARHGRDLARALIEQGRIPPGPWRPGGDRTRNLYIGPPRPGGIDVGRMDSPELAARVVEAVNAWREGSDHLAELEAAYRTAVAEVEQLREHSAILKRVGWILAVALGEAPGGAEPQMVADPVELAERVIEGRRDAQEHAVKWAGQRRPVASPELNMAGLARDALHAIEQPDPEPAAHPREEP